MKNIVSNFKLAYLSSFMLALALFSCKKEEVTPANNTVIDNTPKGSVALHLHTYLGEEIDQYNLPYSFGTQNRKINITAAQIYISNLQLIALNGTVITVKDSIKLKVIANTLYNFGKVPVGNYQTVRFTLGLDSATNIVNPVSDQRLNNPDMFFAADGKTQGSIFFQLEGQIDTTSNASAPTTLIPFSYRIGTNANARVLTMPIKNFSVTENNLTSLHTYMQLTEVLNVIEWNKANQLSVQTLAENANSLAKKIVNQMPLMFKYEE
jgi:hypothetical protein